MQKYDLSVLYEDKIIIGSSAGAKFLSSYSPNWNGEGLRGGSAILPLNVIVHYGDDNYLEGDANWKILSVDAKNNLNDSSIVVELDYGSTKYLFMGDATTKVEEIIERLKSNNIDIYRTDKDNTIWVTSDGTTIYINPLEYNLDGTGRKQAIFLERKYLLAFFFNLKNWYEYEVSLIF